MDKEELREDFEVVDMLVEHLRGLPREGAWILNPRRLVQFHRAERVLRRAAEKQMGQLTAEVRENEGWACLRLEAPGLTWDSDCPLPAEVAFANNMDIYPLANGNIRFDMMFYGLTQSLCGNK